MHKKTKGSVAELAVATALVKEGWHVLIPYGENTRYDLVAERGGVFKRIQVKYVTPRRGVLRVNCQSSNNWSVRQYTAEEIDTLAVYNPDGDTIYFVPVNEIRKGGMVLRLEPTKNGQKAYVRFAQEFSELQDAAGSYQVR